MSNSKEPSVVEDSTSQDVESTQQSIIGLLFGSPVNTLLTLVIAYLVYRLIRGRTRRNRR